MFALLGAAGLVPSLAVAQSIGASPEEVLRLPAQVRAALPSLGAETCSVASAVTLADGEVADITFAGIDAPAGLSVPIAALDAEWTPIAGASVSREQLQRLVGRLECVYREDGFVFARAELAAAGDGRYRLSVNEGRVASVEAATPDDASAAFLLRAFSSIEVGEALNARDVRAGLARAAAHGLTNVRPTIRRSRTDPTAIDLILVAEPPSNQAFVGFQNGNTEVLGPWGAVAGVRLRSLTPLYEQTTIGLYRTLEDKEQRAVQVTSEALLTTTGLTAKVDYAYSLSKPQEALAPLEIKAETNFAKLELGHPIIVRRGLVAGARAGFEAIDQTTELFGAFRLTEDRIRVMSVGARAEGLTGSVVWTGDLSVRKGIGGIGAAKRSDDDLSRFGADPKAWVIRAETQASAALPRDFAVTGKIKGQWADQSLLAFEEFNFGALSGGRGFDPGAISGDSGISATIELSHRPVVLPWRVSIQPLAFVDAARAWNLSNFDNRRSDGASGGLGMRMNVARNAQLDVMWAEPLGRIVGADRNALGPKIQVQFSTSLDWSFREGVLWGAR